MRDQCRRSSRTLEVDSPSENPEWTVETRDKQEGEDLEMTTITDKRKAEELERTDSPARARARTMSKVNAELSRKSKETPWAFTPWMRIW